MTNAYDTFAGAGAQLMGQALGETVVITPKGGAPVVVPGVIVLRDPLRFYGTRPSHGPPEYALEIHVPVELYPPAPHGSPTIKGDVVELLVRVGDTVATRKTVTKLINSKGGMFYLGLD